MLPALDPSLPPELGDLALSYSCFRSVSVYLWILSPRLPLAPLSIHFHAKSCQWDPLIGWCLQARSASGPFVNLQWLATAPMLGSITPWGSDGLTISLNHTSCFTPVANSQRLRQSVWPSRVWLIVIAMVSPGLLMARTYDGAHPHPRACNGELSVLSPSSSDAVKTTPSGLPGCRGKSLLRPLTWTRQKTRQAEQTGSREREVTQRGSRYSKALQRHLPRYLY